MLKSMTGFGKAECLLPSKKLTIEVKSLNSKQIDTSTRLPVIYKTKDLEIRQMLSKALERGKVECNLHYEMIEGAAATINTAVVKDYIRQLKSVTEELQLGVDDLLTTAMRLPDTIISEKTEIIEEEWDRVREALERAIGELDEFRMQEGAAMENDLVRSIKNMQEQQKKIAPYEQERIEKLKERIQGNLEELKQKEEIDHNRFEQELMFYIEKLDINEEQVRLKNHLDYFLEILEQGSPNGKKLGFISQEIGREVNTLGSKANHKEIQRIVVEMKDELERIKEQLLNVL
ncbi:MAG: YicC family protein [Bacteroidales bacterium]|nr:YicC family protein [Bacteroidales bacterium]